MRQRVSLINPAKSPAILPCKHPMMRLGIYHIVSQAVASNRNTLAEEHIRLGKLFPDAFLSNPALNLILIENSGLLLNIDEALDMEDFDKNL